MQPKGFANSAYQSQKGDTGFGQKNLKGNPINSQEYKAGDVAETRKEFTPQPVIDN